jgi:hypothetical protein
MLPAGRLTIPHKLEADGRRHKPPGQCGASSPEETKGRWRVNVMPREAAISLSE